MTVHRDISRFPLLKCALLSALVLFAAASPAAGAILTKLTIANSDSGLPSGQFVYATVTVSATGTVQSDLNGYYYSSVRFEVDPISFQEDLASPLLATDNFGLQKFAFNYVGDAADVTLSDFDPLGWQVKIYASNSISSFGKFEINATGKGSIRANPLLFTATTTDKFYGDDASEAALLIESAFKTTNEPLGTTFNYAVHVGSFSTTLSPANSAWFADGPITGQIPPPPSVPEPASIAIWCLGLAIGAGVSPLRRRKRK